MGTSVLPVVPGTVLAATAPGAPGHPDRRDRVLPMRPELAVVVPDGGLVRGRTVACVGPAAPSTALALVGPATAAGSWVAVVGWPWLGVEAATEAGVVLERVVAVDPSDRWADVVAAAADGFDLVLTTVPPRCPTRVLRSVHSRLRARGSILVTVDPVSPRVVGSPGLVGDGPVGSPRLVGDDPDRLHHLSHRADLVLVTGPGRWSGLDRGHGHLRARQLDIVVTGRRVPRPRRTHLTLGWPTPLADPVPLGDSIPLGDPILTSPSEISAATRLSP